MESFEFLADAVHYGKNVNFWSILQNIVKNQNPAQIDSYLQGPSRHVSAHVWASFQLQLAPCPKLRTFNACRAL